MVRVFDISSDISHALTTPDSHNDLDDDIVVKMKGIQISLRLTETGDPRLTRRGNKSASSTKRATQPTTGSHRKRAKLSASCSASYSVDSASAVDIDDLAPPTPIVVDTLEQYDALTERLTAILTSCELGDHATFLRSEALTSNLWAAAAENLLRGHLEVKLVRENFEINILFKKYHFLKWAYSILCFYIK